MRWFVMLALSPLPSSSFERRRYSPALYSPLLFIRIRPRFHFGLLNQQPNKQIRGCLFSENALNADHAVAEAVFRRFIKVVHCLIPALNIRENSRRKNGESAS